MCRLAAFLGGEQGVGRVPSGGVGAWFCIMKCRHGEALLYVAMVGQCGVLSDSATARLCIAGQNSGRVSHHRIL